MYPNFDPVGVPRAHKFKVTNLKICIRFVFVSDCNLSNFGGPSSKKECDWTQVSRADLKHFLNMLSDPVIKAFHAHDTCCLTSDRYLLAMVFVYFKKAKLEHEEYNRLNFFKALYLGSSLAHIFTKSATTNVRYFFFTFLRGTIFGLRSIYRNFFKFNCLFKKGTMQPLKENFVKKFVDSYSENS